MTAQEILQKCTVEGNVVKLPPGQLDRSLYIEVSNAIKKIGGKWVGGKTMGFVFPSNPTELLQQIAGGIKRNLKKESQFFGTPDKISDWLVELADPQKSDSVLEPSAGQGAIIEAINRKNKDILVDYFELMPVNRDMIEKKIEDRKIKAQYVGDDFLKAEITPTSYQWDVIIANPPFSNPINQDIDHVRKMYECLRSGGRLVSIMSKHWVTSSNKKENQFRDWLSKVDAKIIEIEAGAFSKSGTQTATVVVIINKKQSLAFQ